MQPGSKTWSQFGCAAGWTAAAQRRPGQRGDDRDSNGDGSGDGDGESRMRKI